MNLEELRQYKEEVYEQDWRYKIGYKVGHFSGVRHGMFMALGSMLLSLVYVLWLNSK